MEDNQAPEQTPDMAPETTFSPELTTSTPLPSIEPTEPAAPTNPSVPVMPPPLPMAVETPETPQKKKSTRFIIGGIAAAVIVLLGAGGALAYTQWYQNPDKVIHDAIIQAVQAKSLSTTGDVSYKAEGVDVKMTLDSKSKAPNGEINAKATVAVDTPDFKHTFDASGSVRIVGDTVYARLSGIQKIINDMREESTGSIPTYVDDIVKKIDDKWISINASDYEDTSKELSEQQTCFTKLAEKVQSDKAMMDEVTKLYKEHQIIVVKEKLGSKAVHGVNSLGYKVGIDKDATAAFIKGLDGTTLGKEMKSCSKDIDFEKIAKDATDESSKDTKTEGKVELWVSQFGHELTEVVADGKDDDASLTMTLQPIFNKDSTIEAPKDATPLKTLTEDIQNMVMHYYMGNTYMSDDAANFENMDTSLLNAA